MADLWENDQPITDLNISVPAWIEQDITPADVAAIIQGGCESGAYMPAVTYYQAAETMNKHGDDVLDYITDCIGCMPGFDTENTSWSGLACKYLSYAVELWASSVEDEISDALDDELTDA